MNLEDLDADDLEGDLSLTARPNYSQDRGDALRENSKSPSVETDHIAEEQETVNTSPSGKRDLGESSEEAVGDDEYLSGKENIHPSVNAAADERHIDQKSERTPNRWASGSLGDSYFAIPYLESWALQANDDTMWQGKHRKMRCSDFEYTQGARR